MEYPSIKSKLFVSVVNWVYGCTISKHIELTLGDYREVLAMTALFLVVSLRVLSSVHFFILF